MKERVAKDPGLRKASGVREVGWGGRGQRWPAPGLHVCNTFQGPGFETPSSHRNVWLGGRVLALPSIGTAGHPPKTTQI